jgi:hypothetical protein
MACRSDYMEPTTREKELQETAQLYVWYCDKLLIKPYNYKEAKIASKEIYTTKDFVESLCTLIRQGTDNGCKTFEITLRDNVMDPMTGRLVIWWDKHKKADEKRFKKDALKILGTLSKEDYETLKRYFEKLNGK